MRADESQVSENQLVPLLSLRSMVYRCVPASTVLSKVNSTISYAMTKNKAVCTRNKALYAMMPTAYTGTAVIVRGSSDMVKDYMGMANQTRMLYRVGKLSVPVTTANLLNYANLEVQEKLKDREIMQIMSAMFLQNERDLVVALWKGETR